MPMISSELPIDVEEATRRIIFLGTINTIVLMTKEGLKSLITTNQAIVAGPEAFARAFKQRIGLTPKFIPNAAKLG